MSLRDRRRDGPAATDTAARVVWLRARMLEELDVMLLKDLGQQQRRAELERLLGRLLADSGYVYTAAQRADMVRQVVDEALGLGALEPLLADATITEIMINGLDSVWVEREGRIQRLSLSFSSELQLMNIIDRIVSRVNRRVDETSPMVDARLPGGERVNVVIPPAGPRRPDHHHPSLPAAVHDGGPRRGWLAGRPGPPRSSGLPWWAG